MSWHACQWNVRFSIVPWGATGLLVEVGSLDAGVPFAAKISPPVADLASKPVQDYSDGQLKWIIENGIRFSGMPAWKGILTD